eukprot:461211_1
MDELVIIVIVVCDSLCFIAVILVAVICGMLKKTKKESLKQAAKIFDPNDCIPLPTMNDVVKIPNNKSEENIICQDMDPGPGNEVVMTYTNEGDNGTRDDINIGLDEFVVKGDDETNR